MFKLPIIKHELIKSTDFRLSLKKTPENWNCDLQGQKELHSNQWEPNMMTYFSMVIFHNNHKNVIFFSQHTLDSHFSGII